MYKTTYLIKKVFWNGNTHYHGKTDWQWDIKDIPLKEYFDSSNEVELAIKNLKDEHNISFKAEVIKVEKEVGILDKIHLNSLFDKLDNTVKEIKAFLEVQNKE